MFSDADRAVMKENYRNSRMGREAINVMISKVEDDDLALDLNRQACKFMQFEEKIQKEYMKAEEPLPEAGVSSERLPPLMMMSPLSTSPLLLSLLSACLT